MNHSINLSSITFERQLMASNTPSRRDVLKYSGMTLAAATLASGGAAATRRRGITRFNLDFSDPSDAAGNTATSPGWVLDRYNPNLGYDPVEFTTAEFDGDDRLCIELDGDGPTSGFYNYQGQKYQDADGTYWFAGDGSRFGYDFYIDPAWETDGVGQETGVWAVLGTSGGDISAFPILEYQDSDASDTGEARFRTFVYATDENGDFDAFWLDLGIPNKLRIDPEEGGWVSVEAQLQNYDDPEDGPGSALKWRINNKLVYDARGYNVFAPSTQFLEFIFNSGNFGVDQQYYYDNVVLTDPEA